ncbi:MAG: hypothetical protein H6668_21490 [Ardenticatenaceae bacterium]|nr:hypothetical protein [Ardenticatenaceae bacterium]
MLRKLLGEKRPFSPIHPRRQSSVVGQKQNQPSTPRFIRLLVFIRCPLPPSPHHPLS